MAARRRRAGAIESAAAHLLLLASALAITDTDHVRTPDPVAEVTLIVDPLPGIPTPPVTPFAPLAPAVPAPPRAMPAPTPPPAFVPPPLPAPSPAPPLVPSVKTHLPPVPERARPSPMKPRETISPPTASPATATSPAPPVAEATQPTPGWDGLIAAWLATHKKYPDAARRDDAEGDVTVRFVVAPDGHVLSVTILHGSGSDTLDEAARAMLRAAVLPAPRVNRSVTVRVRYRLDQAD